MFASTKENFNQMLKKSTQLPTMKKRNSSKEEKAKKVLKSQKNSSSESDVDVRLDDESDCKDFVGEDLRAAESDKENEENITSMVTSGDYALVKFNT
ncbi:hypothetical protein FQA39_LY03362 [Lamprigera yunnana]|nr:hypothetical protein FQA39_LY03362 [Lamprigera yunnana]